MFVPEDENLIEDPIDNPEDDPIDDHVDNPIDDDEQSNCWHSDFYVIRDTYLNKLFTRTKGWTGGDATYSTKLPNGKQL